MTIPKTFMGYKRENGRVGVRNHVVILPVDDISNACVEAIGNNIKGTTAIPHSYGRLQFGKDLELFFRTIIGTGKNPNVAAVIVVGIEPKWTKKVVDEIAKTGKPVEGFSIEGLGDITTTMKASKKSQEFVQWASEKQREECPLNDLWISVKCGESDTTSGLASNPTVGNLMDKLEPHGVHLCFGETSEITGAEKVCASRAKDEKVKKKFLETWNNYNNFILENKTNDLSESQPTAGNIKGGLTTIEEKAFGNLQKIGKKIKYIDVLESAEEPKSGKGLYFMDTSSAAAECVTLQAAAGFTVHLFPTGQGNIIGNPIEPVIKLTANPKTASTMSEHIDLDVSKILKREMNLSQAGDALIDTTVKTANGRITCAEALGHKEFVITKLYRSA
ncbi:MAG: D-galactarate dehydratase [Candidatus Pelagibacter sp.]|jgi:(2R)-sulfolactate sulfo-lyase subunit beta|nr:D-galactarate dehydratase [Candidatus Pelagibacter sp.]MDP6784043.1 UxaA family hydrolase [Alphaproteobacteria bacterium]